MTTATLNVVRGTTNKPIATDSLIAKLADQDLEGNLLIGYPVMATPDGPYTIDALLISPRIGLVCFDLVEGTDPGHFQRRQDNAFNRLSAKLLSHKELVKGRTLLIKINTISYAPAIVDPPTINYYPILNEDSLRQTIPKLSWPEATKDIYQQALSVIHNMTAIRRANSTRHVNNPKSRGSKLRAIEKSISTLDLLQSQAVIETADGVQRIRGLAGSGKTIVLALKAAYLHIQHPDWKMAVTFNTRSLKGHFTKLINNFLIRQTGEEPNWTNLQIVNSWGAPGAPNRDGIYHQFCRVHEIDYLNYSSARSRYGQDNTFSEVVTNALGSVTEPKQLYDTILVDEAQDLPPAFLRLCYEILTKDKRLVYAYDELQNLTNEGLPSPEEIFGMKDGKPRVTLEADVKGSKGKRDIILEKCYRNSRPVLTSAHGLGFGIYRDPPDGSRTGIVQMFARPTMWTDIGYSPQEGQLALGQSVVLSRTSDTSPGFLENHSEVDDLIIFEKFDNEQSQAEWVAAMIEKDLNLSELRHSDIIVISTDPLTARAKLGRVRKALLDNKISSHLAGVDTSGDTFFQDASITCTGIHRAKGNEAAMVYIINGDECYTSSANLPQVRNRLFAAITRSKAWVRVTGVGPRMQQLIEEYKRIRDKDFLLEFRYPSQSELDKIKTIHRDMSDSEQSKVELHRQSISDLVLDLKKGRIFLEDIDESARKTLLDLLSPSQS